MNMLEETFDMIDTMLESDWEEMPNLKAMVAIRDTLVELDNEKSFANDIVSSMDIEVDVISPEDATKLGKRWAVLVDKFIDIMYNNGFSEKNIVTMASQMNLKCK